MTKKNISAIILAGNGTNCEIETAHACRMAGFEKVDIVTVWELVSGKFSLDSYDFLCLPGGFLDGDDLGSAKAQANRILNTRVKTNQQLLFEQFVSFIKQGKLILGICNGFQLMVKAGFLPNIYGDFKQNVTLTHNDSGRFEDRWVWLKSDPLSPCIFTKGISTIYLPVRHGEGKFIAMNDDVINILKNNHQIVFSYIDPKTQSPTMEYPYNPNGSLHSIAGICDPTGRLFGLMPHPEAYLYKYNNPKWTRENLPEEGMGLKIFKNAYNYLSEQVI
jgi:phosphoribosylformylglycinamidine synthase